MKRPVDVDYSGLEQEGLLYDLARAREEGLHEEMTITLCGAKDIPITVTPELFEALLDATDLAVNVEPGRQQSVLLLVKYKYDYGHANVPV